MVSGLRSVLDVKHLDDCILILELESERMMPNVVHDAVTRLAVGLDLNRALDAEDDPELPDAEPATPQHGEHTPVQIASEPFEDRHNGAASLGIP
jgi:hypothetical protein